MNLQIYLAIGVVLGCNGQVNLDASFIKLGNLSWCGIKHFPLKLENFTDVLHVVILRL